MLFRSKAAVFCSMVYLLLVVAALVIMILSADSTPMSGIFLVILTVPWPSLLDALGAGNTGSALGNGLLLFAGGLVNAVVIYLVIGAVASLIRRNGQP